MTQIVARMPMRATTMSSSMRVKPLFPPPKDIFPPLFALDSTAPITYILMILHEDSANASHNTWK